MSAYYIHNGICGTEKGEQAYDIVKVLADWYLKYELIKPKISINY